MACFSNATMREPVKGKPHIAKIDGLWRVSSMKNANSLEGKDRTLARNRYIKCHTWTNTLNQEILYSEKD